MAEAAAEWDGRVLVRPNVVYDSVWDADILHGCVCDPGWIGHDCSQLECPRGDDPLTEVAPVPSYPYRYLCFPLNSHAQQRDEKGECFAWASVFELKYCVYP